jgi:hypothetical protein
LRPPSQADRADFFCGDYLRRPAIVERSGLLREPIEGQIDFRHRTFQEFFTAQAITKGGEAPFLLEKAEDDQWRETITLAAGLLRPTEGARLLRGLLRTPRRPASLLCIMHIVCMVDCSFGCQIMRRLLNSGVF